MPPHGRNDLHAISAAKHQRYPDNSYIILIEKGPVSVGYTTRPMLEMSKQ